jgi:signal transduction histidine kinase/ligand-binding sensor domain-containing protein
MRVRHVVAPGIIIAMLLGWSPRAHALDPSLDISQYAHTSWRVRDGVFAGSINAITQTPDGYLWLGTEFGLVRFDGVRPVPWQPTAGDALPAVPIVKLLTTHDGTLWIGGDPGLASLKAGKLTRYPELADQRVSSLLEDRDGAVWVGSSGTPNGRLCVIQNSAARCSGEDGAVGEGVAGLYEDRRGNLWVGVPNGMWRWRPGPPQFHAIPEHPSGVRPLGEDPDGVILITWHRRITRLVNGRVDPSSAKPGLPDDWTWRFLDDRDGGRWFAMQSRGLARLRRGRTELFAESDGLSGDTVRDIYEDREGNIWVATFGGLDRFRDLAVSTLTQKQGLPTPLIWSLLAARDGSVWMGSGLGLTRWRNGQLERFGHRGGLLNGEGPGSLFEDRRGRIWVSTNREVGYLDGDRFMPVRAVPGGYVFSIVEDSHGDLWIMNQQRGVLRLRGDTVQEFSWAMLGRTDHVTSAIADPANGIWLGFEQGGVALFSAGSFAAAYSEKDGLGAGEVLHFRFDASGALWAATKGGLTRIRGGRLATLSSSNGLPCDAVHWSTEDDAGVLWVYTACGLVRIERAELDAWTAAVEKDPHTKRRIGVTMFDSSDGVRSNVNVHSYRPRLARTADGRLWFLPVDGVSTLDPRRLGRNELPPPVYVERVIADRARYDAVQGLRLPPLIRDLQIDYTALSLVAPEKNRFRVMLEGRDTDWNDVGTRREAFYTDLAPGSYRFRVRGSNNSGVWNEADAALEFSIAPAYYQTRWFRALVVGAALVMIWAGYVARVRHVGREYQRRLDERVNERIRIARELHDTLLQSFHGLLLRFQTASYLLPERPAEAKAQLDGAIVNAAKAITEGRDAVQGLRASTTERNDLALAIRTLGDELATIPSAPEPPSFDVAVEGEPRDLHPIIRDEVYKIAAEALRNAFRHAHAGRVEVEIRYHDKQFRLRVRDDGVGIGPAVLRRQGMDGHYGLRGMPERAALIGGKLTVWSEAGAGTEVELSLPARIVYAKSTGGSRWSGLLRRRRRLVYEETGHDR